MLERLNRTTCVLHNKLSKMATPASDLGRKYKDFVDKIKLRGRRTSSESIDSYCYIRIMILTE